MCMSLSKRKLAWVAFSIAFALLVVIGAISYGTTKRLVESERLISHTHEVQTYMEDLRSDLIEAGYARRGYLISGDERFVTEYRRAVDDIPSKLSHLKQLTLDNPKQQARLSELQQLVDRDVELLNESIERGRGGDLAEQGRITTQSAGLESEASAIVRGMRTEENRLLETRQGASKLIYRRALNVLVVGLIFALLLLAAEFYLFNREITRHQETGRVARQTRELL